MKWKESFHPYAMITIFFWSLAYVLTRIALGYFSPFTLGFLRYLIASCAMLLVLCLAKIGLPEKKDVKWFVIAGATGFFFYMIFFNLGSVTVNSSTSSMIVATVPIITALFARYVHGEQLKLFQWIAILIAFAGVNIITLMNGIFKVDKGILWLLLAAVSLSLYNLIQRKLTKTYPALQTTAFSIFTGTFMLALFSSESVTIVQNAPLTMIICVLILGIFSSTIAYAAWSQAFVKAENTSSVSNYMFVTPFLASLMGFLIAGEKPDFPTIMGGFVILSGLLLFYYGDRIHKYAFYKIKVNLKSNRK
ncbi:MAG: EamA family transporter [Bacillota bacterium]